MRCTQPSADRNDSGWPAAAAAAAAAAVFAFGGASGAHLNPAVSLMLLLRGKISSGKALAYMVAQVGVAAAPC
jgi:aquaporin Z